LEPTTGGKKRIEYEQAALVQLQRHVYRGCFPGLWDTTSNGRIMSLSSCSGM